jgi:hypothetical protein
VPRKPGPKKRQVLLRILESSALELERRAEKKGETLPRYLSRNIEASVGMSEIAAGSGVAMNVSSFREVEPRFKKGAK